MTQALRARPYLVALVVLVAIAAAVGVKATSKSVPTGAATVQLMVDSPRSALADLKQDTLPLVARAQVFAQLMTSGAVLNSIAKAAGLPPRDVTAEGPYSGVGQALDVPTPSEARGVQLVATNAMYHLTIVPDTNIPLVTASVEGPNPTAAGRLANAVYPGVESWLKQLQASGTVPASARVTIRQLGDAEAGTVNSSSATTIAGAAGVAVLVVGCLLLIGLERRRPHGVDTAASMPGLGDGVDMVALAFEPTGHPEANGSHVSADAVSRQAGNGNQHHSSADSISAERADEGFEAAFARVDRNRVAGAGVTASDGSAPAGQDSSIEAI